MKPGQYLEKNGEKHKILGVCGEIIFYDEIQERYDKVISMYGTKKELLEEGFTLPKEKWVPEYGDTYYFVSDGGEVIADEWNDLDMDQEHLAFGNCFKTREEAEAHRDKIKAL